MTSSRPQPGTAEARKWIADQADCSVFVSCTEEDRTYGLRLRDALARHGVKAWVFKERQFLGFDWLTDVEYGVLESCDVGVFLLSETFKTSYYSKDELRQSVNAGWGPTLNIALVLDGCDVNSIDGWQAISRYDQAMNTNGEPPRDEELEGLAQYIADWLQSDTTTAGRVQPPTPAQRDPSLHYRVEDESRAGLLVSLDMSMPKAQSCRQRIVDALGRPSDEEQWLLSRADFDDVFVRIVREHCAG